MPRLMLKYLLVVALLAQTRSLLHGENAPAGKKYAVLIGVQHYNNANFSNLEYSEADVVELAKVLRPQGFEVMLLSDSQPAAFQPNRAQILARLQDVVRKCQREDLILFAFAGHGIHVDRDRASYFVPRDAQPNQTTTMVSLNTVYSKLEACGAGVKLMLVDACRVKVQPEDERDPTKLKEKLKKDNSRSGVNADNAPPPRGVSVFFSCSAGAPAWESSQLRHGVFFYHVLQGLRGSAKNAKGTVTWLGFAAHVTGEVKDAGFGQAPVIKGEISDGALVRPTGVARGKASSVWSHHGGAGSFAPSNSPGQWVEKTHVGTVYTFKETQRTAAFVELNDASRGITIRLYKDACHIAHAGTQNRFALLYHGGWNE